MDSKSMQQATREAVKKKFGTKRLLPSKVITHYPQSLEREYIRLTNAYMSLLKNTIEEYTPRIRSALASGEYNQDAAGDKAKKTKLSKSKTDATLASVNKIFDDMEKDFAKRQGLFGLSAKLEKLSKLNRKLTTAEWKRVVKRTLGIDISEDYYKGEKFQKIFDKWVADNTGLIKTVPQDTLGNMRDIVKKGYLSGATTKSIGKQIQDTYGVSKSRAQFIARDQMSKLNAQVTQQQHADAGVTEYVWRTASDGRVREGHARLNNKRFKYSEPPIVDSKAGRRAHPGEDFQCRCVPLPVFDIEDVVLPWEKGSG